MADLDLPGTGLRVIGSRRRIDSGGVRVKGAGLHVLGTALSVALGRLHVVRRATGLKGAAARLA